MESIACDWRAPQALLIDRSQKLATTTPPLSARYLRQRFGSAVNGTSLERIERGRERKPRKRLG